jgi:hypothetical protein
VVHERDGDVDDPLDGIGGRGQRVEALAEVGEPVREQPSSACLVG